MSVLVLGFCAGVESGKPTHFTVFTKGAGKAPLDVQFSGAGKGEPVRDFEIIDNYDYSHTVKYTPVQQVGWDLLVVWSGTVSLFTIVRKT